MKKIITYIFISILSLSCEREIQMYDDLDAAEQAEIDNRSTLACTQTYSPIYDTFKDLSSGVFDSSSYERGNGFYYEYKQNGSADVKKKMVIRVWKLDSINKEIYFYVTETQLASESYFLRFTLTQNNEMISDLLVDHCAKFYQSTSSSSGPLSVLYEFEKSNAPNTDIYSDTYSLAFNYPAFFANFQLSRSIKTENSSGVQQGSTVNYTSSLTTKSFTFDSDTATDSAYYTQKFCTLAKESIDVSTSRYRLSTDSNTLGFKFSCTETTPPAEWNLTL